MLHVPRYCRCKYRCGRLSFWTNLDGLESNLERIVRLEAQQSSMSHTKVSGEVHNLEHASSQNPTSTAFERATHSRASSHRPRCKPSNNTARFPTKYGLPSESAYRSHSARRSAADDHLFGSPRRSSRINTCYSRRHQCSARKPELRGDTRRVEKP